MYTDFKYLLEAAVLKAGLTVITGTNEWLPPWIDSEYDICYTGSRTWNTEILLQQFPKLTIHYTGNMTLNLFPKIIYFDIQIDMRFVWAYLMVCMGILVLVPTSRRLIFVSKLPFYA